MIGRPDHTWKQAAAIPYRVRKGTLEVALVTSSSGKRWVLPKGCIDPGERAWEAAERETEEEAGLRGKVRWASSRAAWVSALSLSEVSVMKRASAAAATARGA